MKRLVTLGRLCSYDLRCDLASSLAHLALVGCFAALLNLIALLKAASLPSGNIDLGLSGYIATTFGGSSEFIPERNEPFVLPAAWLCCCLAIAYATLAYPARHLKGIGTTTLILSGSRWLWWLSKCVWVVIHCFACCAVILATCTLFTIGTADSMELTLDKELAYWLGFFMATDAPFSQGTASIGELFTCIVLALTAISLIQLVFSVLFAPFVGFIVTICILFASAFCLHPALIGNYLMIARSNLAIANGVDATYGTVMACVVAVTAVLAGGTLFNRQNILRRTDAS